MGAASGGGKNGSGSLSSLMSQINNGQNQSSTIQNVTPQSPIISGNGLQQAQNSGQQFIGSSQGKGGQGSGAQLMGVQPPGQAQNTATSGQPIMGQPNQYMNTIGQNQQPFSYVQHGNGKGKG